MIARSVDPSAAQSALAGLTLAGPDAETFLQGYLTCDVETLREGVGTPMAYCNIKGRVLANGWAHGRADRIELIVHASVADLLAAHLSKYLVFARSRFGPASLYRTLVAGEPQAAIELRPPGWFAVPAPDTDEAVHSGAGTDLDRLCIGAGFAVVSAPVSERFLPQMLGLTDIGAVSFTKGCYLGQEVVARAQYRGEVKRRIRPFSFRGSKPEAGATTSPAGVVVHAAADGDDAGRALVVTGSDAAVLSGPDCELVTAL